MANEAPATDKEVEQIREYYRKMGYAHIEDETARAQKRVLRIIREQNNAKVGKT